MQCLNSYFVLNLCCLIFSRYWDMTCSSIVTLLEILQFLKKNNNFKRNFCERNFLHIGQFAKNGTEKRQSTMVLPPLLTFIWYITKWTPYRSPNMTAFKLSPEVNRTLSNEVSEQLCRPILRERNLIVDRQEIPEHRHCPWEWDDWIWIWTYVEVVYLLPIFP